MKLFSRVSTLSLSFLFCTALPSTSQAASVTYNFSYSGVNTLMPSEIANGTGFFTVTYTAIGPQPPTSLTGFSFLLTLTSTGAQPESSTFAYNLSDVPLNPSVILGGTVANPIPNQIDVVTSAVPGTDNIFGSVAVDLNMLPAGGSILTQGYTQLGNTSGSAVWTSIVDAPEPSALWLLAIGALLTLVLRLVPANSAALLFRRKSGAGGSLANR